MVGTLPEGLSFNTGTRRITGTPTSTGTGTITIRATNSNGTDDWTVSYSITLGSFDFISTSVISNDSINITIPFTQSTSGTIPSWAMDSNISGYIESVSLHLSLERVRLFLNTSPSNTNEDFISDIEGDVRLTITSGSTTIDLIGFAPSDSTEPYSQNGVSGVLSFFDNVDTGDSVTVRLRYSP